MSYRFKRTAMGFGAIAAHCSSRNCTAMAAVLAALQLQLHTAIGCFELQPIAAS
jgi:hypothetical protein